MKFSFLFIFTLYAAFSMGQSHVDATLFENDSESFTNVTDSIIKRELSVFCSKAAVTRRRDSIPNEELLKQMRIYYCSDSVMVFDRGNWISYLGVNIQFAQTQPKIKLNEIIVEYDNHNTHIPASALIDITNTPFCQPAAKRKKITTHGCAVYWSKNSRYIYIHMISEEENNRFEVTWIVKGSRYYGRVVDRL